MNKLDIYILGVLIIVVLGQLVMCDALHEMDKRITQLESKETQ